MAVGVVTGILLAQPEALVVVLDIPSLLLLKEHQAKEMQVVLARVRQVPLVTVVPVVEEKLAQEATGQITQAVGMAVLVK